MRAWRFAALAFAAAAAGCSALTPFATDPSPAAPEAKDPRPRVAICYNPLKTPPEKVREMAQAECFGNTTIERVETDYRLDTCPLTTPSRATFACTTK
jgi:hypothetical protein